MTQLKHHHFKELGFTGNHIYGYIRGNIDITIHEDEDCNDRFFFQVDGIDKGWVKTYEQLETIIEDELIQNER